MDGSGNFDQLVVFNLHGPLAFCLHRSNHKRTATEIDRGTLKSLNNNNNIWWQVVSESDLVTWLGRVLWQRLKVRLCVSNLNKQTVHCREFSRRTDDDMLDTTSKETEKFTTGTARLHASIIVVKWLQENQGWGEWCHYAPGFLVLADFLKNRPTVSISVVSEQHLLSPNNPLA